jgi:hypothetical protein
MHSSLRNNQKKGNDPMAINWWMDKKRPHTVWFHLCGMSRIGKSTQTDITLEVAGNGGGEGLGESEELTEQ